VAPHLWRHPSAEDRAAAVLHPVKHSVGFVLTAHDPGHGQFSFRVDASGQVHQLAGWGYAGPVAGLAVDNPPATLVAVHTILVEPGCDARGTIRSLVDEHLERYAECRCWCVGLSEDLAMWVRAGCPDEAVPAGDKLA
jgi:hypothetical protein